jgi:hypothetical protein
LLQAIAGSSSSGVSVWVGVQLTHELLVELHAPADVWGHQTSLLAPRGHARACSADAAAGQGASSLHFSCLLRGDETECVWWGEGDVLCGDGSPSRLFRVGVFDVGV